MIVNLVLASVQTLLKKISEKLVSTDIAKELIVDGHMSKAILAKSEMYPDARWSVKSI